MSDTKSNAFLATREGLPVLPEEVLDEVADLVLRLHLRDARRAGAVLSASQLLGYRDRPPVERAGMRSAVQHVMHALILRELIEIEP